MKLLDGQIAIITGAASPRGLGKATAQLFADHGARVVILDLDAAQAEDTAADIGEGHIGLACDVTRKADCEAAVAVVLEAYGQIDILVNNAGITQP
jgi:NAD(P)-dependent dehydrogenase (short-subunit alcohol dehydrogenase family)